MIEFKGTKGKLVHNRDESDANMLLISKAPEMLEMLEEAMIILGNIGEFDLAKKIQKLIKESTTL